MSYDLEGLLQFNNELPVALLQVVSEVILDSINGFTTYLQNVNGLVKSHRGMDQ